MTGKDVLRQLRGVGCREVRKRGSHVRVECGECTTTVPVHAGQDLPPGTLRAIERDLEPCLGKGWLKR
ncbi:MAG TPA: type II toxin-antitoxin system HicA family toxin [Vicinamibacteria bacterium]|nr:type II toxin-antitoxin system HicA family toxin [Vicinamibacteria bacterium]